MKSKILRAVSVVMLSAFLTVTAVPCSTRAADSVDPNTCRHLNVTETKVDISYPNALENSHQVKAVYDRTCNICGTTEQVTRIYSESHSFGANRRCTKCGYYAH